MSGEAHVPVLAAEVVAALAPRDGGVVVDGTFGAGGYSRAVFAAAPCRIYGIDRDPEAVARGRIMEGEWPGRLVMLEGRFGDMDSLLAARGVREVDGVALDLGVSSAQLDSAERGFSFRFDAPLDMRMEKAGPDAGDAVNGLPEARLADIIWRLGEERHARRVARAIVAERRLNRITSTRQLAELVSRVVPRSADGIDPATRTFQALRIHVNDELGEIDRGLAAAERILRPGGRLAVVSFHSLEDRLVKDFLRQRAGSAPRPTRHAPSMPARSPSFRLLTRKPILPSPQEVAANPRARSAKLRAAERLPAPGSGAAA